MIRYALVCAKGHAFESWFPSSAAYDKQAKRGLVTCPTCGISKVEKAIMAPKLSGTKKRGAAPAVAAAPETPAPVASDTPVAMMSPQMMSPQVMSPQVMSPQVMSSQEQELRQKLKELREHLTKNSDYVGKKFPEEARKMHYGEIDHRSIYGEASLKDAEELHEEGIEFHPLPVLPDERN